MAMPVLWTSLVMSSPYWSKPLQIEHQSHEMRSGDDVWEENRVKVTYSLIDGKFGSAYDWKVIAALWSYARFDSDCDIILNNLKYV
mgnify:CR=1 FL=1